MTKTAISCFFISLLSSILDEAQCLWTLDWTWLKRIPVLIFPTTDACSLDCLPSTSWGMDSKANFSWNLSDSNKGLKEKLKTKYVTLPVKNIPPPTLNSPSPWQYPEYLNFSERFATFHDWPKYLRGPAKKDLARAGFIYTRIGDKVTCFSCVMTLKNWEPQDDAYNEHIRWSKHCPYAKMVTDGKLARG